jgi:hypothetical protein
MLVDRLSSLFLEKIDRASEGVGEDELDRSRTETGRRMKELSCTEAWMVLVSSRAGEPRCAYILAERVGWGYGGKPTSFISE